MGTVIVALNLKFKINPKDHNPPHVHIEGKGLVARVNLLTLEVMSNTGFGYKDMKRILQIVEKRQEELMEVWNEYFE